MIMMPWKFICVLLLLSFVFEPKLIVRASSSFYNGINRKNIMKIRGGSTEDKNDNIVAPMNDDGSLLNAAPNAAMMSHASASVMTKNDDSQIEAAPSSSSSKKNLLQNSVVQRVMGSVISLTILSGWMKLFGSKGVIGICLISQLLMYEEVFKVTESHFEDEHKSRLFDFQMSFQKWWLFIAIQCFTSVRVILSFFNFSIIDAKLIDWIGYGMLIISLIVSVVGMENKKEVSADVFRMHLGELSRIVFSLLYLVGQSSFWISTLLQYGMEWIIYSFLLVIVNDTMAYAFGKVIGKTKLLPSISPNKTIEGFFGAAFSTFCFSIPILNLIVHLSPTLSEVNYHHALVLAAFASFVAPFGGFFASIVKRAFLVKDFGDFIPGHGGVMDRLDCHVVMAPFCYLYLKQSV